MLTPFLTCRAIRSQYPESRLFTECRHAAKPSETRRRLIDPMNPAIWFQLAMLGDASFRLTNTRESSTLRITRQQCRTRRTPALPQPPCLVGDATSGGCLGPRTAARSPITLQPPKIETPPCRETGWGRIPFHVNRGRLLQQAPVVTIERVVWADLGVDDLRHPRGSWLGRDHDTCKQLVEASRGAGHRELRGTRARRGSASLDASDLSPRRRRRGSPHPQHAPPCQAAK